MSKFFQRFEGWQPEPPRPGPRERRPGREAFVEAAHQEAAERVHALHEGDEAQDRGRVHLEGVGRHQSNSRKEGENKDDLLKLKQTHLVVGSR